jgi:hypothetical protein
MAAATPTRGGQPRGRDRQRSGTAHRLPPAAAAADRAGTERALPPTIRVSIGRVEVRAIMPPAAAPPQPVRTAPSGPSLAAYLRQRDAERA